MSKHLNWVDYAKGLGIILVVYGHITEGIYNAGMAMDSGLYTAIDTMIYSFHMPLFFFLSGLFFTSSFQKRGLKNTIINKVDTIFYPFVIWSILQGIIEATLSKYTNGHVTYTQVFSLLWEPRAQFWFLYALFFTFVIACLLFMKNRSTKQMALVAGFFSLVYIFQSHLPQVHIFTMGYAHIAFFFIGVLVIQLDCINKLNNIKAFIAILALFIVSEYWFAVIEGFSRLDRGFCSFIIASIGITFIVTLSMQLSKLNIRLLAYIGESSLYIYLLHVLIGSGTRIILQKLFHVESATIQIVIGCIAAIGLSLIFVEISKKFQLSFLFKAPWDSSRK
ncbi:acyltransferase [Photobacterium phosphoreum]|uniref:Acyltransferase n=1 Tax=Photobacterium phosphoreum TaxID=659 RepID=A0A2T3JWW5_PHOPO|nr:acyltransferase [Photobacterium phosphoreum]PSU27815.1 acyltransferase [Photobacterium phosphoreum]PSU42454.1 acyltransferase [Photobacterium phosphoreum]PSU53910.1 acyltransferase [Photobacterium phosphoreum]